MKKILLAFVTCGSLLQVTDSRAQSSENYYTGFDDDSSRAGWKEFREKYEAIQHWEYDNTNYFSPGTSLYHEYPVDSEEYVDDWMVSPPFTVGTSAAIDSLRFRFSGFGTPVAGDTIAVYLLTGSSDPTLSTHTLLYDFRGEKYQNDAAWHLLEDIDIPSSPDTQYLAFRYRTKSNWLDVRFDNIAIRADFPTDTTDIGVPENSDQVDFKIFPNPAENVLNIKTSLEIEQMVINDITGKIYYSGDFSEQVLLKNYASGIYIVHCKSRDGRCIVYNFLKE